MDERNNGDLYILRRSDVRRFLFALCFSALNSRDFQRRETKSAEERTIKSIAMSGSLDGATSINLRKIKMAQEQPGT